MSFYQHTNQLADIAAESVFNRGAQETALESHLQALRERHEELERLGAAEKALAEIRLQMGRTLVALGRGDQAWQTLGQIIGTGEHGCTRGDNLSRLCQTQFKHGSKYAGNPGGAVRWS